MRWEASGLRNPWWADQRPQQPAMNPPNPNAHAPTPLLSAGHGAGHRLAHAPADTGPQRARSSGKEGQGGHEPQAGGCHEQDERARGARAVVSEDAWLGDWQSDWGGGADVELDTRDGGACMCPQAKRACACACSLGPSAATSLPMHLTCANTMHACLAGAAPSTHTHRRCWEPTCSPL